MLNHTPGPWKVIESVESQVHGRNCLHVQAMNPERAIARVWPTKLRSSEVDAIAENARVIAEAPAMLDAIRTLVTSLDWERKRSGTSYHGFDDACAILDRLNPPSPAVKGL